MQPLPRVGVSPQQDGGPPPQIVVTEFGEEYDAIRPESVRTEPASMVREADSYLHPQTEPTTVRPNIGSYTYTVTATAQLGFEPTTTAYVPWHASSFHVHHNYCTHMALLCISCAFAYDLRLTTPCASDFFALVYISVLHCVI